MITPLEWSTVRDDREHVNENLKHYLSNPTCIVTESSLKHESGEYLYELTRGYISILIEELHNLSNPAPQFWSGVTFGRIYTELWRIATRLQSQHPAGQSTCIKWADVSPQELLSIEELKNLNKKWLSWTGSAIEQELFHNFATNLADAYLLAYGECSTAAAQNDATAIKHHMLILGDIFQEMLMLHATLMPRKNSRFDARNLIDGNGESAEENTDPQALRSDDVDYVEFYNPTDFSISLHIDWIGTPSSFKNTVIPPDTTIEIEFGPQSGRICHRSDGGTYSVCPANSPVARAGDFYTLEQDGNFGSGKRSEA